MKIIADANAWGIARLWAKYLVNVFNAKIEARNNASNKIIKPVLFGFDLASLKLLMNKDSLITVFFGIFFSFI